MEYNFDAKYTTTETVIPSMELVVKPCKWDISYFFKGVGDGQDPSGSVGPTSNEKDIKILHDESYCFSFYFQTNTNNDISMLITLRDNVIQSDPHKTNTSGNNISRIIDISCGGPEGLNNNFDEIYDNFH
jgi:hypothetical protein